MPLPIWLKLFMQKLARPRPRACWRAGRSIAARIAMIAITTSSSMRVKCFFPGKVFIGSYLKFPGLCNLLITNGHKFRNKLSRVALKVKQNCQKKRYFFFFALALRVFQGYIIHYTSGEMAEWPKATVSKIVVGATSPRVRIPLSPPFLCSNSGYFPRFFPVKLVKQSFVCYIVP